jgi:hypothetical protein
VIAGHAKSNGRICVLKTLRPSSESTPKLYDEPLEGLTPAIALLTGQPLASPCQKTLDCREHLNLAVELACQAVTKHAAKPHFDHV